MSRIITPALALAVLAGAASAQSPADYNRARAYRHYLNSPSPFKTYTDLQVGRSWGYDTPWESARYWRTPGYYYEEASPRGRWADGVTPRVGGYVVPNLPLHYPPYPAYPDYPGGYLSTYPYR